MKVAVSIFEKEETCLQAFDLFKKHVLGDEEYIKYLERSGTRVQKMFIEKINSIDGTKIEEIRQYALELGALTYQHAYFVDPRMIEAVASFQDSGSTRIIGLVNRLAALTIPHNTFALKGYGDKKSQQMFANAHAFAKVLLVKKSMYDRNTFYTTTFESQT